MLLCAYSKPVVLGLASQGGPVAAQLWNAAHPMTQPNALSSAGCLSTTSTPKMKKQAVRESNENNINKKLARTYVAEKGDHSENVKRFCEIFLETATIVRTERRAQGRSCTQAPQLAGCTAIAAGTPTQPRAQLPGVVHPQAFRDRLRGLGPRFRTVSAHPGRL